MEDQFYLVRYMNLNTRPIKSVQGNKMDGIRIQPQKVYEGARYVFHKSSHKLTK